MPPDSQYFDSISSLKIKYIYRYVLDLKIYLERQIVDESVHTVFKHALNETRYSS